MTGARSRLTVIGSLSQAPLASSNCPGPRAERGYTSPSILDRLAALDVSPLLRPQLAVDPGISTDGEVCGTNSDGKSYSRGPAEAYQALKPERPSCVLRL